MREKLEIALLIGNFHLNKRRKNKIVENNEKIFNSAIQFPTNRFYGQWSSQRPPASVGVNIKNN